MTIDTENVRRSVVKEITVKTPTHIPKVKDELLDSVTKLSNSSQIQHNSFHIRNNLSSDLQEVMDGDNQI
jgi:hypothetical protein